MSKAQILAGDIFHNPAMRDNGLQKAQNQEVSRHEINYLKRGIPGRKQSRDMLALLYVQHWSLKNGTPDSDFRAEIVSKYGEKFVKYTEYLLYRYSLQNHFQRITRVLRRPAKKKQPVSEKSPQQSPKITEKVVNTME